MLTKRSSWITCPAHLGAPIVYKQFSATGIRRAMLSIVGLGYYELFVNGVRVGDEFFKPAVSDYAERDFRAFLYPLPDKTSHTVYYNVYDLAPYLHDGENLIAVMLGNGFFRQRRRLAEGDTSFSDALCLRYELALTDAAGSRVIATDGTERAAASFITENNLFFGEVQDFSGVGNTPDGPMPAVTEPVSGSTLRFGRLRRQRCPNDRIREVITPRAIGRTAEGTLYDVGKNISGFVTLTPTSPTLRVRHAEELRDGRLDFSSTGGEAQIHEAVYLHAEGRRVHPWFSFGGFRYFEVIGEATDITVAYVTSDVALTSSFVCDSEPINWLFSAYTNGQLGNMHGGVPSDCPHRERLGYTGDGQLTAECAMLLLDSRTFYEKWIRDIADCQDRESGHIQHTAPFFGGGGGPGGWGCAAVVVPAAHYKIYGDLAILRRYFPMMLGYLRSMRGFCEDGLIVREREGGWCLGEWCTPDKVALPEAFINTYYYIKSMETVKEIAALLGERVALDGELEASRAALCRAYYDPESGDFCGGVQGANAFGLMLGLGDRRTHTRLLSYYRERGGLDTGIFGTDVLCEYLVRVNELSLLYSLLSAEGNASFGFMRSHGATTLWEDWSDRRARSHNHPMFGGCVRQLFYGFLGLSFTPGGREVTVRPRRVAGLGHIEATVTLPSGTLTFDYRDEGGVFRPTVSASGEIHLRVE